MQHKSRRISPALPWEFHPWFPVMRTGIFNRKKIEGKATQHQMSQELLDGLCKDMESMHNVGLEFSVHDASGRTIVKVVDKETKELIREIPPEDILDFAAKMQEMIGILFDKKV